MMSSMSDTSMRWPDGVTWSDGPPTLSSSNKADVIVLSDDGVVLATSVLTPPAGGPDIGMDYFQTLHLDARQPGSQSPLVQSEGTTDDGRPWYFRARNGVWSLHVGPVGAEGDYLEWCADGEVAAEGTDPTNGEMSLASTMRALSLWL